MRLVALALTSLLVACVAPSRPSDEAPASTHEARIEAPAWLLAHAGHGTWSEGGVVRAWADARVANVRYDKRVLAEVVARYEGGAAITTLHPARFKGTVEGAERWGTDAIEIHDPGPNGARLAGDVLVRFRFQHAEHAREVMVETPWASLLGDGSSQPPAVDPWAPGLSSPVRATTGSPTPEVRFAPFDDPGAMIVREIDAVIAAKVADPEGRHTVHAAVFNIGDGRIVDRLIAAHRAGVEVRLITDAKKLRPQATWMTGDDALLAAGVPLLGVGHGGRAAMHLKLALFDGKKVATGSANWEHGSSFENHEATVLLDDPGIVAAYAQRFERIAGGVVEARAGSPDVVFGPDERPDLAIGRLIDAAKTSVHVAMFTAKDWGGDTLFRKLVDAKRRGVDVTLITDARVAEGSEYHGLTSEDDRTDEALEAAGVRVVRAAVPFAKYASMHHKMMVVDGETTVLGAFNWYWDSAFLNDEDLVVLRDRALAARCEGEIADLLRRYDPAWDPSAWPRVELTIEASHAGTAWGEGVMLVGDLPELGGWSPASAVSLDGARWPVWSAKLTLTAGTRARFKLVTRRSDGTFAWEAGDDRALTVATGTATQTVRATFRP